MDESIVDMLRAEAEVEAGSETQEAESETGSATGSRGPYQAVATAAKLRIPTRAGQLLAMVLLDPRYAQATAQERARAAGISLRQYFQLLADPDYREYLRGRAIDYLAGHIGPILRALAQTAATPGRDGTRDRELALRLMGWLVDEHRITGPGGGAVRVEFVPPAWVRDVRDGVQDETAVDVTPGAAAPETAESSETSAADGAAGPSDDSRGQRARRQ